jgi:HCOMODA/2-hydroxy-3-carboxy-muconic semialdehyde decarboxylase
VIPFTVTPIRLRPVAHVGAAIGAELPVWDIRDKFGDTNLLVVNMDQGRDLAKALGDNRVALMRGHGNVVAMPHVQAAVTTAIQAQRNARLQMAAMQMGEITFLSEGEINIAGDIVAKDRAIGHDRAWEYYVRRAGCEDV